MYGDRQHIGSTQFCCESKNQSKTLNVTNKQQQKIFPQLFLLIRNKFYSSEHAKNL